MKSLYVPRFSSNPTPWLTRCSAVISGVLSALLLPVLGLVAVPSAARALTALTRDFDGLVARAECIFKGTVIGQESLWLGEGSNRHIATRVTFQVLETYKGVATSSQRLEFLGGTIEGKTMRVPGVPRFIVGETAVLFVVGNGAQICPLVGAFQGRFAVERDPTTAEERVYGHDHRPITSTAAIGQGGAGTLVSGNVATTPRARIAGEGTGGTGSASSDVPALTATQFKAAITQKLQERRVQGLPEVQSD